MKMEKSTTQHKKEETKLQMVQLAEKCIKEEAEAKAQVARNAMKLAEQQKIGGQEHEGQKSPSPRIEAKTKIEQGGMDPQTTSTQLKHPKT